MATSRSRLVAVLQHRRRVTEESLGADVEADEANEEERVALGKRQLEAVVAATARAPQVFDARDAEEVEEDMRRATMYKQQLKKIKPLIPGVGRGKSEANLLASRKRTALVFPAEQGGIYGAHTSSQIRYKTGFTKEEFDDFFAATHIDREGNLLPRSWFFQQARNNLGKHTPEENQARRTIRGSMSDQDRVLCYVEMLRRDTSFEDMSLKYGRSKGTWSNEFHDMTMAAQDMPCLQQVETVRGSLSDRGALLSSDVFQHPDQFLSADEVGMGDGNYRGLARADSNDMYMCAPHPGPNVPPEGRRYNREQRRFRVVVENTIGQIKKFKTVGNGKAFRHQRDFEKHVFNVCARLTARIMRVRNKYPRSEAWIGDKKEEWEAKLGIHYYWDYDEPGCYLIHNEGENLVYDNTIEGTAEGLQEAWDAIWLMD
ncbi:unnamed protein product [Ectocarpus sp. CCAP 1310/34]|nr:unnamed protein product [Ectocarpus sp. CCAP 1310/34]